MKRCAFCPQDSKRLTGEHIWSAWVGRLFPRQEFQWVHTDPETQVSKTRKTWTADQTVNAVCNACNNGWMSDLESEASALLSDMIRDGTPKILSTSDLSTFAAFAFKNAIIANYMNPRREPFFTRAVRERFRMTRAIPAQVQMWFGSLPTVRAKFLFFGYVLGPQVPNDNSSRSDLELYVFTWVAGHLIFQVAAPRYASLANRGKSLGVVTPRPFWDHLTPRFWPRSGAAWPPGQQLNNELLQQFLHRWEGVIRFF